LYYFFLVATLHNQPNMDSENFEDLLLSLKDPNWDDGLILANDILKLAKLKSVTLSKTQEGILKDCIATLKEKIAHKQTFANTHMGIYIEDEAMFREFENNPNIFVLDCLNDISQTLNVDKYVDDFERMSEKQKTVDLKLGKLFQKGKYSSALALQKESTILEKLKEHRFDPLSCVNFGKTAKIKQQILFKYAQKFQKLAELKLVYELLLSKRSYYKVFKHALLLISHLIRYLKKQSIFTDKRITEKIVFELEQIHSITTHKNAFNLAENVENISEKFQSKIEAVKANSFFMKILSNRDEHMTLDEEFTNFFKTLLGLVNRSLDKEMKEILQIFEMPLTK
jgi:hypothetical protein